ncbi:major histocompatibility complex class I-related gene protein-like isoform X2 [Crotalus tigris]|uniref:major histocompatibility complex class I-related gene protein-like isoform X2 n=1 Tax=Crotalus tigris TaxID=88082 RepID=UPI00192F5511|nr:major histocompatibility complex class I-related gene protein-like isoform X2 [Crotalus tigris]
MRLHRAPLLLLGAVLGSLVPGSRCGSFRHSLCYSYLKVSEPSQGLPHFLSMVHLDDQPIARFGNHTRKMEPLVPWMEMEETKIFVAPEWVLRADLEMLSNFNHQTRGRNRSQRGFLHYGYDGSDFISFDKETLRWVAAQPQAEKVKEKWEENPGCSQRNKFFLEKTCIEWLQRKLSYKNEALQRTEPPVGKVTRKVVDDSLEVLICQAFGFYPKEIQATWTRDGEACVYETLPRNVAPNSDGTYYVWLSIEIDPKKRDHFRCHLEHQGLQEPLILAWKEETDIYVVAFPLIILILMTVFLILLGHWLRSRKKLHQDVTTSSDDSDLEMHPSVPIYGTEDKIQPQAMLQPKTASEHKVSCGGQWPPKSPRATGRTFHRPRNVAPKKMRSSRLDMIRQDAFSTGNLELKRNFLTVRTINQLAPRNCGCSITGNV